MAGAMASTMRLPTSEGMTMIVVTHEMAFAREVFFKDGSIHEIGGPNSPERTGTASFLHSSIA